MTFICRLLPFLLLVLLGAVRCGVGPAAAVDAVVDGQPGEVDVTDGSEVERDLEPDSEHGPDGDEPDSNGADAADGDAEGVDTDSSLGTVADRCETGEQCEGGLCITDAVFPGFEGGYCSSLMCDAFDPLSCGVEGICVEVILGIPTVCAKRCAQQSDCRADQACVGMCIPGGFVSIPPPSTLLEPGDAPITALVSRMDLERMQHRIAILSGAVPWDSPAGPVTISSRAVGHPHHELAIQYLEWTLSSMGLQVQRLEFEWEGLQLVNIQAILPGTDPSLEPVLVTAHYDSTAKRTEDWVAETDPAPGAVDNGTGVVVVLEIAQLLSSPELSDPPQRGLQFLLFDGEEIDLLGLAAYVEQLSATGGSIGCVVNADMIGWTTEATPDRFWFLYHATDATVAAIGYEAIQDFVAGATPIPTSSELAGSSDHAPFWEAGHCALTLSTFPYQPTYHTVADTSDTLDAEFFASVARSAAAVVAAWVYHWND